MSKSSFQLTVPFPDSKTAAIAYRTLTVDKEPKRSSAVKNLQLNDNQLLVSVLKQFNSPDPRSLRVGVNSFLDLLKLTVETIEQFGE
ncbi:EKC/KEOPS complex subunit LAGE3 [Trichoplax sp. H2]|nr:EKC/KEOPS complex subunit LAGE3 [Trichoplax sp. H2]|eukprot:RDD39713.1 EKC/KEOPS complex subunit LAGE3 [Trichoplax sp. H2]